MTPERWKDFARYLVAYSGIFQCVISGGEPLLLGDDLFGIMDILHGDRTSLLVISNSLLMTQEKVRRFTKYRYKWFQISIDGVNREQKNVLYDAIMRNIQRFSGRMSVQRSSGTKIQLMRSMNTPNTGAIIRPDGNIRLDCVAPFVIGNVISEDFCTVWQKKAGDVWSRPEILEYFDSWEDEEEINHGLRNYFDADVIF